MIMSSGDPVGAVWRRWDPHIHAPGTVLNNQYKLDDREEFLAAIERATPTVEAIGITDYYLLRTYQQIISSRSSGRLQNVGLIFCNIEMRLSIETRKSRGINLHLLVAPERSEDIEAVNRFMRSLTFQYKSDTYRCEEADLRRLGFAYQPDVTSPEQALEVGVNQFKVSFKEFREAYEDSVWIRKHTLIGVSGSSTDGTAGLQDDSGSFGAMRKEIESFAHVIFSATPSTIKFWRGDGTLSEGELLREYRGLKPCLHGSDAHALEKVANPSGERYCWIKGDLTFETLRQASLEPRLRVHIGSESPASAEHFSISSVATPEQHWPLPASMPLNPGMVAIIGSRGSGKTALADLIAHAADSPLPLQGSQSFLSRAGTFLARRTVESLRSDGTTSRRRLDEPPEQLPDVNYLTQQFVDTLCSTESQSDALLQEIKRVVFLAHDPSSRMGATDFDALVEVKSSRTQLAAEALNLRLDRLSQDVLTERDLRAQLPELERSLKKFRGDLHKTELARKEIVRPGGQHRAEYYARLNDAVSEREQQIQALELRKQAYLNLLVEVERYSTDTFPRLLSDLRRVHGTNTLAESEWAELLPRFTGSPQNILQTKIQSQNSAVSAASLRSENRPTPAMTFEALRKCSLQELKDERDRVGRETSIDDKNAQRLIQLNKVHASHMANVKRLEDHVERAQGSGSRVRELFVEREVLYEKFFDLIIEQCETLTELYEPSRAQLSDASSSARKLSLAVIRDVDTEDWARQGEELLDLRKSGELKGRGAIAEAARQILAPAWQDGSASEVRSAMEEFRNKYDETMLSQSRVERGSEEYQQWTVSMGRWLYSTDHINVRYSIEYEGVPITQLSPGTRGIVLLLLYLSLDLEDSRPLIIDQPEENLDPKSVYTELVELFREARMRRQVIIVTHNANLVVNTDVDQVIVASCTRSGSDGPPLFEYQSGGLENPNIRSEVCEILEGGESAFKERARRLRVVL